MKGKIPEKLYKACGGDSTWSSYGVSNREYGWQKFVEIDLEKITLRRLERLRDMIAPYTASIRGTKTLVRDIETWIRVLANEKTGITARTVEQFALLLTAYINGSQDHWLFEHDESNQTWFGYYVESIQYHPPQHARDGIVPASVTMDLFWIEFGHRHEKRESFHSEDCVDLSIGTASGWCRTSTSRRGKRHEKRQVRAPQVPPNRPLPSASASAQDRRCACLLPESQRR
jgi:hypothetical protein